MGKLHLLLYIALITLFILSLLTAKKEIALKKEYGEKYSTVTKITYALFVVFTVALLAMYWLVNKESLALVLLVWVLYLIIFVFQTNNSMRKLIFKHAIPQEE